jgi:peptidylprolyl isomerase
MVQAKIGDTVRVRYTGRLADGSTFDTSMHRDPLEFTLGDGELIPGFEKAVLGMNPGDTKTATIPAEQAYGAHRPEMVFEVDRQQLPPRLQPYVGQRLQMTQQDGTPRPGSHNGRDGRPGHVGRQSSLGRERPHPPPQPSKQPQRPYPTPSYGACPAPAKAALHRNPLGSEACGRAARGRGARQAPQARMAVGGGGRPGERGEKGRLDFLYVGRRASASDKSRFRQPGSLWGLCPAMGEFVLGFAAIVTGCSTEPHGRDPPKSGHSCGNFSV